jgi:hypothetical protein
MLGESILSPTRSAFRVHGDSLISHRHIIEYANRLSRTPGIVAAFSTYN